MIIIVFELIQLLETLPDLELLIRKFLVKGSKTGDRSEIDFELQLCVYV